MRKSYFKLTMNVHEFWSLSMILMEDRFDISGQICDVFSFVHVLKSEKYAMLQDWKGLEYGIEIRSDMDEDVFCLFIVHFMKFFTFKSLRKTHFITLLIMFQMKRRLCKLNFVQMVLNSLFTICFLPLKREISLSEKHDIIMEDKALLLIQQSGERKTRKKFPKWLILGQWIRILNEEGNRFHFVTRIAEQFVRISLFLTESLMLMVRITIFAVLIFEGVLKFKDSKNKFPSYFSSTLK